MFDFELKIVLKLFFALKNAPELGIRRCPKL